jgi:hypothetical protein
MGQTYPILPLVPFASVDTAVEDPSLPPYQYKEPQRKDGRG